MALQPRRCAKLLPYTSFVSVAAYRSDFFSVDFWAERSPTDTWSSVAKDFLPDSVEGLAREGVLRVAAYVDKLEAQLGTDNLRREDLGLGNVRPKKLNDMSQQTLRPYFRTIFLDRLLWSFIYSGGPLGLRASRNPDLPDTDKPRVTTGGKAIVGLTPTQMTGVILDTLIDFRLLEQCAPEAKWAETVEHFANSSVQEELLGASESFVHSVWSQSMSQLYQRCSNVACLAASLNFLCMDAEKDPWAQFVQATDGLKSPQSGAFQAVKAPYDKSVAPANRTATALAPAFASLCHSPLFTLNKEVNLLQLAGLASNALRWGNFLAVVPNQPSSQESQHFIAEAMIWRAVAGYMGTTARTVSTPIVPLTSGDKSLQDPNAVGEKQVTEGAKNFGPIMPAISMTMGMARSKELHEAVQNPVPAAVTEVVWGHSKELPYKIREASSGGVVASHDQEMRLTGGQSDGDDSGVSVRGSVGCEHDVSARNTVSLSEAPKRPHATLESLGEEETNSPEKRSKPNQGAPGARELRSRAAKPTPAEKQPQLVSEASKKAAAASKARATKQRQNNKPSPHGSRSSTINNRVEPQYISPLYRSTSYAPPHPGSKPMDWVSIAETLPSPDEVESKGTNPECFTEDEFTLNAVLTENGALKQQPRKYKVDWPAGTEFDRGIFKQVMEHSVEPTAHKGSFSPPLDFEAMMEDPELLAGDVFPSRFIETILSPDVPLKWVDTICRLFASRTILVPNPERSGIPESWEGKRTLSARDLFKRYQLQVDFQRQVHKLTARSEEEGQENAHMCKSSIAEVLADGTKRAYNFLDIPSPGSNHMPSFLIPIALDSLAGQLPMAEGYPQYSTKWNLFATSPALSRAHIDAAKFATWLKVLRGAKVWAILQGPVPPGPLSHLDISKHLWKTFLIEEGDVLVMPPGEVHLVLNVEDCFAAGGHFYATHSFRQSFAAGVREHMTGAADTNTEHIGAEFILHNLVWGYHKLIPSGNATPWKGSTEYQDVLENWPPLNQMAALLVMAGHPRHFEPQRLKAKHPFTCSTDLLDLRQKIHDMISDILRFVPEVCPLILELESKVELYKEGNVRDPPLKSLVSPPVRGERAHPSPGSDSRSDLGEE